VDVTLDELLERFDDPDLTILDVRTPQEYAGVAGYRCDPRQGHIPGARNLDVSDLVGLTPEELRRLVRLPEGAEIVAYCHSGARSEAAAELLRAAGYRASNYRGSWHEWSRREELPANAGEEGERRSAPPQTPI
jgi:3-mercaptopyruvate sulfurtransferase SseA